jgi:hypothetical protein
MVRSFGSSRLLFGAVLVTAASGLAAPMAAEVVHLRPVHDTTLYQDPAGTSSNGTGVFFYAGRNGNGTARRGLVAFDVAGAIPRGSTITSATLSLFAFYTLDDMPRSVELHRLLSAWGEGTSADPSFPGGGANAMPGDATWVHTFYPAQVWDTPGGDFDISISAAADVAGRGGYGWTSARMRTDVQRWLDDPTSNFGWLLRGEESVPDTDKGFFSRERGDSSDAPLLAVEYTPPAITSCVPDPTTLCLDDTPGDARFAVRIHFASDRDGGFAGDAHAVALADRGIDHGGLFWFFSADNPEALVKVLDGCASNQHFWVFFSAATNVGLTLDVLDEHTGEHYQRTFPDGVAVPVVQEVNAMPCS